MVKESRVLLEFKVSMKKVAILQSNYIPWKGYFDLIAAVDEFIVFDDMQYTRRDWRNRNQIKTPNGVQWLTVPVKVKGRYYQKICETEIDGNDWAVLHWKTLEQNYRRAPHFDEVSTWLRPLFIDGSFTNLSKLNCCFIKSICDYLQIKTKISHSWDYALVEGKTERLADLCLQAGAKCYVSGPSAREYLNEKVFEERGLSLFWFNYEGYPEYSQLWGDFTHRVSILDLLFNTGRDSYRYMRCVP